MAAISSPELGYVVRTRASGGTTAVDVRSPSYQAFRILQFAFVVVPIVAGLDKFFDLATVWEAYLAPQMVSLTWLVGGPHHFMQIVGVLEICAGLLVAFKPKVFGWVLAGWFLAVIIDLFLLGAAVDIALRDGVIMLAAVALARLGARYDGAIQRPRYVEREMGPDSRDVVKP